MAPSGRRGSQDQGRRSPTDASEGMRMLTILLIVVLVVVLLGGVPASPWGRWHGYGYWPGGIVAVLLVVLLVWLLLGGRL